MFEPRPRLFVNTPVSRHILPVSVHFGHAKDVELVITYKIVELSILGSPRAVWEGVDILEADAECFGLFGCNCVTPG